MKIEKNLGLPDRFTRVIVSGFLMIGATYLSLASGLVWLAMVTGSYLMITALIEFCPVCAVLKISTIK